MNTKQIVFDTAVSRIIAQGTPAIDNSGTGCAYRSEDDKVCAVGACILDEFYDPKFEGMMPSRTPALLDAIFLSNPALDPQEPVFGEFLDDLQWVHDEAAIEDNEFLKGFVTRARVVAQNYNLEWNYE